MACVHRCDKVLAYTFCPDECVSCCSLEKGEEMAYRSSLAEHLDPAAARKERGAFFTPPQIASFLTSETILSRDDRVLEPSCGEAALACPGT